MAMISELHQWFLKNKRDFPWREAPTPYKVWVSEVMLQQTRASVVIPYFLRWLELFPDVVALARAPLEKAIKAWEGLGYYSRVRNLHRGAQEIVRRFGGQIPSSLDALSSVRGIGAYTAGAILSFGFHKRAVAIDANAARVLSRFFAIEERLDRLSTKKKLAKHAEQLLDSKKPWVTVEALIELGATFCLPKPYCALCPIEKGCLARQQNKEELLPIQRERLPVTQLHRAVAVLLWEKEVLVKKQEAGKVMADLYEFPYFEGIFGIRQLEEKVQAVLGVNAQFTSPLSHVHHTFTRFKAHLVPSLMHLLEKREVAGFEWVEQGRLLEYPFSSGHRKIAQQVALVS